MKTLAEMISVMQAAERGEEIECIKLNGWDKYELIQHPVWNWQDFDYRVKPKPRTRPFTRQDMTDKMRWIRSSAPSEAQLITLVFEDGIGRTNGMSLTFSELAGAGYEWSPSINGPWHPFTKEEV